MVTPVRSAQAEDLPALELAHLLHFTQSLAPLGRCLQPLQQHQLLGQRALQSIGPLVLFALASKVDLLLTRREVLRI